MEEWEKHVRAKVNRTLPNSIEDRIEKTLQQLPQKKRKLPLYGLTAAFAAFTILFGLSFLSPAIANTIKSLPVIGTAFEFVGDIGVKKGKLEGLTVELGEQVEVDGQLITFTESLYDGGEIHIGYLIDSKHGEYRSLFSNHLQLLVNGRDLGSYGMGGHEEEIKAGLYAGTFSVQVREGLPETFLLGIKPREGKAWFVELPVEKKGNNKSFIVNKIREHNDLVILFDQITVFPTSTELSLRLIMDEDAAFLEDEYMLLDYQIIDSDGRVLQPLGGGGGGEGPKNGQLTFSYQYYFEPLETIPQALTIKPYLRVPQTTAPKRVQQKWQGTALTLSQGEMGEITILDIRKDQEHITLTSIVEGDDLYRQANAVWLEASDGTRLDSDTPAKRIPGTTNQYELTFSTSLPVEDLVLSTVQIKGPLFLEELEVLVELTK